jgi:GDP-L-fucose synthase
MLTEQYPKPDPVNLGTDQEVQIRELVFHLLEICGVKRQVIFDASKPAGQPRRNCDTQKAKRLIGFEAKIGLVEGLKSTVKWYKKRCLGY